MRRWAGAWIVLGCSAPNPAFDVGLTVEGSGSGATTATPTTGLPIPATTGDVTATTTGATTDPTGTSTGDSNAASSTGMPAVCGNGVVEPGEACDDGPAPSLEPGACRPNCAGEIAVRTIFVTPEPVTGNFATNADLTQADEICGYAAAELGLAGGFRAMISDGVRVAAKTPYDGECSDDWPLQPFTAYRNYAGQLVWVTGKVRLLGVVQALAPGDPNVQKPLLAALDQEPLGLWTGLSSTWQTASTCAQWQGGQVFGTVGESSVVEGFLDAVGDQLCAADYNLVCVQQ